MTPNVQVSRRAFAVGVGVVGLIAPATTSTAAVASPTAFDMASLAWQKRAPSISKLAVEQ